MESEKRKPKCKDIPTSMWYPSNSKYEDISVYRLTFDKDKVTEKDFLSKYELDKLKGKDTKINEKDDMYFGLSVLEDKEDAEKIMRKVPVRSSSGIACGTTKDGLIRRTPSATCKTHITWWLFDEAKPVENFGIVKERNNE